MTRADGKVAGKYGRLPETADSAAVPYLHELATSPFPPLPAKVEVPDVADWGTLGNDVWGDCVIAGMAHAINAWNVDVDLLAPVPNAADVIAQYCALTGAKAPGDANDTGLIIGTVLKDWATTGLFGATDVPAQAPSQISAYARVSLGDGGDIRQGIACYGAVIAGFNMPQSAEDQFNAGENFTYVPGSPIVGGHEMVLIAFDGLWVQAVTWGTVVNLGPQFTAHYMDTAFVAIPPAFITAGRGPTLNLAQLQADIGDLD